MMGKRHMDFITHCALVQSQSQAPQVLRLLVFSTAVSNQHLELCVSMIQANETT